MKTGKEHASGGHGEGTAWGGYDHKTLYTCVKL